MSEPPFKPFYYINPDWRVREPSADWARIFVAPVKNSASISIEMIGQENGEEFGGEIEVPLEKLDRLITKLQEAAWALHALSNANEDSWHFGESI